LLQRVSHHLGACSLESRPLKLLPEASVLLRVEEVLIEEGVARVLLVAKLDQELRLFARYEDYRKRLNCLCLNFRLLV
jgi:hypothetical protein